MNSSESPIEASNSASSALPLVRAVSAMHQGARDYQEDACGHWFDARQRFFAVVADGAGGHGGGAEAAEAAVQSSAAGWQECFEQASGNPDVFLTEWMRRAHAAVNEAAARINRSARAVVVGCFSDGGALYWAHAGDCRLLRFRGGKLVERTRDDSVVQVLFERGEIREEDMGTHPDQSRLLQSLGGPEAPTPRIGTADLADGDVIILCSDGFWEHLKPVELEKLASTAPEKMQHALHQAVEVAVGRGGPKADNTTALMVAFGGSKDGPRRSVPWRLLVVVAVVAGCAAALCLSGYLEKFKPVFEQLRRFPTPDDRGLPSFDTPSVDTVLPPEGAPLQVPNSRTLNE
jgi:serine/threonine protein phosphatase PrpC